MVFEKTTGVYERICRFQMIKKEREMCEFEKDFNKSSLLRL